MLIAGCATTNTTDASSIASPNSQSASPAAPMQSMATALPSPTPSANPVATAVSTTTATGTAQLTIIVLTTVDGVDDELDGTGPAVFNTGDADLTWQSAAGTSREITVDGIGYVQTDPPDGEWVTLPAGEAVPTLGAGQPLAGLADLAEVTEQGTERLGDVQTTRFTGWLPARDHLGGLGINDIDARGVTDDPAARVNVTVWIDASGRIVRVMRTLASSSGVAASMTTELRDFGASVSVAAPIES